MSSSYLLDPIHLRGLRGSIIRVLLVSYRALFFVVIELPLLIPFVSPQSHRFNHLSAWTTQYPLPVVGHTFTMALLENMMVSRGKSGAF